MSDAIAWFTIRLLLGMGCMLCLMPRQNVPGAFFRIMMLLVLGLAVLLGLTTAGPPWGSVALGVCAFSGSILWLLERRSAGTILLATIVVIALIELWQTAARMDAASSSPGRIMVAASGLATALTLGGAMTGMLLGHRYLTAPGMSLAPLKSLNNLFGGGAVVRLICSAIGLALGAGALTWSSHGIWIILRWLAGICGPLIVWFMVRRILYYKNTQAATGVLFVGVILTFIGELTADVLFHAAGQPL